MHIKKVSSIVLAGGKGVRMNSELPKVLHPLCGRPLIQYVTESLKYAGIDDILVVIGYKGDLVMRCLGDEVTYVWQHEQLGTGHAVMQAESYFEKFDGNIIVACGDVPFIKPETFQALVRESVSEDVGAVILTMLQANPEGYGRIIKDGDNFVAIVEEKDASEEQRKIKEVNSGTYLFNGKFLFDGLKHIDTNNAQGEYYLPDVFNYIIDLGFRIKTIQMENPIEGKGINTQADLLLMEEYVSQKVKDKFNE